MVCRNDRTGQTHTVDELLTRQLRSTPLPYLQGLWVCRVGPEVFEVRGEVNSFHQKQVAQEILRRLVPQARLINRITVQPGRRSCRPAQGRCSVDLADVLQP